MPKIEPFKGVLYNPKKVNPSKVVAPPYDVIPPKQQDELYRASEYNIIRLILGKEQPGDSGKDNKYTRAAEFFNSWLKERALLQDEEPAIYVYVQEYLEAGKKKIRIGFISRILIPDPKKSRVLPHEYTFAKPKQDRLNLIREVKANLSPIFTLFQDQGNKVSAILKSVLKSKPIFNIKYEGVTHKFWALTDKAQLKKMQALMLDKDIFIADGHHRYEVAGMYKEEMRKAAHGRKEKDYNYVMMYFCPMAEEGLTVMATHRMVKEIGMDIVEVLDRLSDYFDIKIIKSPKTLLKEMSAVKKGEYRFAMYFKNKMGYLLKIRKGVKVERLIKEDKSNEWKRLDVSVLHGLIFDHILGLKERLAVEGSTVYTRDPEFAVKEVNKGNCEAAFFLNPTKVTEVRDVAKKGDKMPHKSTYFYPKLLTGLVINKVG